MRCIRNFHYSLIYITNIWYDANCFLHIECIEHDALFGKILMGEYFWIRYLQNV